MKRIAAIAALLMGVAAHAAPVLDASRSAPYLLASDFGVSPGNTSLQNQAPLQAAIDAAENRGLTILLPRGHIEWDTTLVVEGDGVVFRGVAGHGNSPNADTTGTVLWFNPTNADAAPRGMVIQNSQGVGFADLNLNATIGDSGDFVTLQDARFCWMENVRITFNGGEAGGPHSALTLQGILGGASDGCSGNRFYNVVIVATGASGGTARESIGLNLKCTGTTGTPFVTDNAFIGCRITGFEAPGMSTRIAGTTAPACPCNNNRFESTVFDLPETVEGHLAGVNLIAGDRNVFLGVQIDGRATDTVFQADVNCDNNFFIGAIDGVMTDLQTNPDNKLIMTDLAGSGGSLLAYPWMTLYPRVGNPTAAMPDGAMWIGGRNGTGDTLFVHLNGSRYLLPFTSLTLADAP